MSWQIRILYTLILFVAWSVLIYFYVDYSLSTPQRTVNVQVEIKPGASTSEIGQVLKKQHLIRNEWLFRAYTWYTGKSKGLQAGVYEIPPDADLDRILEMVTSGSQNAVTIPEGYTLEQIADHLEKKTNISKEEFIQAAEKKEYDHDFLQDLPDDPARRYRLEGYLFPSTYNIPKSAKAEKVIGMMLEQFEQKMEEYNVQTILKQRNMSVDDWVNVASIVEREARVKKEFPKISGVIYNRLEIGQRLQVDATVRYGLMKQKAPLTFEDLKKETPYNTYRNKGLPPGAISNPGEKALLAALKPEKHKYLYYVTKKDGSGEHYFAETFDKHKEFNAKSKKTRAQQNGE
ncbi:endolytic transglycosylase MltG [Melghirimyces algeriensis]|uniref:Endolytic murein transglycosylase n=1 Tax=Melghirimyces algeriensis TaxID=910412 RepID=A0A521CUW8_9BACL|nr:endolytic transglycosylase MltG [Melghirimyces algeriensis]SMO63249.1 UPF0755 protein [Melghirimyces algeriensis]